MKKFIYPLITGTCVALVALTAQARTNVNIGIDLNASPPPPPPANVVMMPPQGYSNCYMTPGGWMGNVWVPPHQECAYPGPGGGLWVSGYWGCMAVGPYGNCAHWAWFGNRWARGPHGYRYGGYGYGYGQPYHDRHWR